VPAVVAAMTQALLRWNLVPRQPLVEYDYRPYQISPIWGDAVANIGIAFHEGGGRVENGVHSARRIMFAIPSVLPCAYAFA
jgi:hypothetical protein